MRLPNPSYANVVSSLALFIALGGTSYAVASLPKNSVGDRQLKTKSVGGSKIKSDAITSDKIKNGAIAAEDLAPGAALSGPRGPRGEAGPVGATGPAGPGAGPAEAWRALSFSDGWTNYGVVYQPAGYRKDQLGTVHLRGLVSRPGKTPGGKIAQLPAGYRPRATRVFVVHTGEGHSVGRVDVNADGQVIWISGTPAADNGAGAPNYTSLESIEFDTE